MSLERPQEFSDQDFAYIVRLSPDVSSWVEELRGESADESNTGYAPFWLMYLKKYNTLATTIRDWISEEGEERPYTMHENAIRDFVQGPIKGALAESQVTGFFDMARGKIVNRYAEGIDAYVHREGIEYDEEALDLMSVPYRIHDAIHLKLLKA